MGNVLAFRPRKSSGGKTREKGASATVIIFPGVRYERAPEAASGQKWSPAAWIAQLQPQPLPTS
ncbi:hypothetical protein [Mesorhizobium sp. CN2-181]|uniref:hypothetical protein n=1 Tax=Mesorhizobium yinganensis TaxID=3157707 RepID=UPI0032B85A5F